MIDDILISKTSTTLGSWALLTAQVIDSYGLDSHQIFLNAGVDLEDIKKPGVRLPTSAMVHVWQQAVKLSNDPYIALKVANFFKPTAFSALGMALSASQHVYDGLQRAFRYSKIICDRVTTNLEDSDDEVACIVTLNYAKDTQEYFPEIEAIFSIMYRMAHPISGEPLKVKAVYFKHGFKGDKKPFEEYFNCPVYFSSQSNKVVFDKQYIFDKQLFANSELTDMLDGWIEEYLSLFNKYLMTTRVKKYVLTHMPNGGVDLPSMSREFAISKRLLQRKLKEEGSSYRELLDECRHKLAIQLISHNKRPLAEVSYMLNFSDQGNFSRAFKRWTGTSPSDFVRVSVKGNAIK